MVDKPDETTIKIDAEHRAKLITIADKSYSDMVKTIRRLIDEEFNRIKGIIDSKESGNGRS